MGQNRIAEEGAFELGRTLAVYSLSAAPSAPSSVESQTFRGFAILSALGTPTDHALGCDKLCQPATLLRKR